MKTERLSDPMMVPVLLMWIALCCASACQASEYLSVEATLRMVDVRYVDTIPKAEAEKWNRLNPAAGPELRRIISRQSESRRWAGAIAVLGRIGEEEDIPLFVQLPWRLSAGYDEIQIDTAHAVFTALGEYAAKEKGSARDILVKMAHPSYWSGIQTQLATEPASDHLKREDYFAILAFTHLARQTAIPLDPLMQEVLDEVKDPDRKKLLTIVLDRASEHSRGEGTRKLDLSRPPQATQRGAADQPNQPAKQRIDDGELLKKDVKRARAEALREFDAARRLLEQGDVDGIIRCLADNGRPVISGNANDSGEVQRKVRKLRPDIERTATAMSRLWRNDSIAEETIVEEANLSRPQGLLVRIPTAIKVGLLETELGAPVRGLTVGNDGNLNLIMIYVDGRWYWNPFGW